MFRFFDQQRPRQGLGLNPLLQLAQSCPEPMLNTIQHDLGHVSPVPVFNPADTRGYFPSDQPTTPPPPFGPPGRGMPPRQDQGVMSPAGPNPAEQEQDREGQDTPASLLDRVCPAGGFGFWRAGGAVATGGQYPECPGGTVSAG